MADAEATGRGYFVTWLKIATDAIGGDPDASVVELASTLAGDRADSKTAITKIIAEFGKSIDGEQDHSDLAEDLAAWRELSNDISRHLGRDAPLEQFLQELQLRSKEPSPKPSTVTLMTVHGAKGREFDYVYVIGLAEDVMPSYQSRQKGNNSAEMEEERRNCFVAITRTKECLILSRAERYRGWMKAPSRFLVEMGLVQRE
jgi:DNA helicase II / ATP-dependent DNA helicase PcrA